MIEVKNTDVLKSLMQHPFDPKLIEVIEWFFTKFRKGVITEGFRESQHPGDLHGLSPVRAVDLRSWCYDEPVKMEYTINNYWLYDFERPHMKVALFHNRLYGAEHFHIQVHPNTKIRHLMYKGDK